MRPVSDKWQIRDSRLETELEIGRRRLKRERRSRIRSRRLRRCERTSRLISEVFTPRRKVAEFRQVNQETHESDEIVLLGRLIVTHPVNPVLRLCQYRGAIAMGSFDK